MKRSIVLGLSFLALGSAAATALESTYHIDKRQDRQERRINHGIENGSLTKREVKRLRHETRQIQRLESMALRDGHLHPAEIDMLEGALDALSEQIYEAKHNHQYRIHYGYHKHKHSPYDLGEIFNERRLRPIPPDHSPKKRMAKHK